MSLNNNAGLESQNLGSVEIDQKKVYSTGNYIKFIGFSVLGIILFFTPLTINGTNSIPIDHLITLINKIVPLLGPIFTIIIACIGGVMPWVDKYYKKSALTFVLSIFRTLGIPIVFMAFFKLGPEWLLKPDMLPFVWDKVVIAVTMIVPIGSFFLTFIICYGLLEFVGVLVRPIMRPLYRVPGKAAIDAVASFVGSFSVAIYLTNKLYKEGKYTTREAAIIMTGFSTVSATFMIIIAKTANMMNMWNFYFWSTLVITFAVTAFTVRLWPLKSMDDSYVDGVGKPEKDMSGSMFANAVREGLIAAAAPKSILSVIWENVLGGVKMCFVLTPIMASVGLLGFILLKMTPVFNYVGIIYAPFTYLLSLFGLPEPMMIAKACAGVLGEMFTPNLLVAKLSLSTKYIVGVVSVSAILFFAGSIPCILAADVKIKPLDMLVIWFERTVLSILLAGIVALIMF